MNRTRPRERGEGKIGCIITLAVLVVTVALAVKVVPVYYANDQLADAAEELCGKAGTMTPSAVELALRSKAKTLDIPEALAKGAMAITITGDAHAGSCEVRLKYTRQVDCFGAYVIPVTTDKRIMKPFLDTR